MSMEEAIKDAVKREIDKRIEQMVENEVNLAVERIRARVPEIVSGVSIKVAEYVSFERIGSDLRISIKMEEVKRD